MAVVHRCHSWSKFDTPYTTLMTVFGVTETVKLSSCDVHARRNATAAGKISLTLTTTNQFCVYLNIGAIIETIIDTTKLSDIGVTCLAAMGFHTEEEMPLTCVT